MTTADIMIVADDAIIAADLQSRLTRMGYRITAIATSGETAVEKADRLRPDIVLVDIRLQGAMDGIDAAGAIRERFGIPVLFLAGATEDDKLKRTKRIMPFGYIPTPFNDRDIEIPFDTALRTARAETERKKSDARYRRLLETLPLGIVELGASVDISYANPAFHRLLGYEKNELIGGDLPALAAESDRDALQAFIDAPTPEHSPMVHLIRKDGIPIDVRLDAGLPNGDDSDAMRPMLMVTDITEKKRLERARKKTEEQLMRVQKMEALGTLAGGIAHDFNNILFPIVGFAEMLAEDLPEGNALKSWANQILRSAYRAKDLVRQILTFSRQKEHEKVPLKLHVIVKEVMKLIRATIPTTIEIIQDISEKCPPILADPTQMHQILMNLITNAYHAMQPKGGRLEIRLHETDLSGDSAEAAALPPGRYVRLSVADSGSGIDQSIMDRIFEPYFTTKEQDKGTGLGLALVHGIVKNHEGDIRVASTPGFGSTFTIWLPCLESEGIDGAVSEVVPLERGSERILIVDDEDQIINMEKQILERLGYAVTATTDSVEALRRFSESPDEFDVVVTDMTMPGLTGEELAKEVMALRPEIPVVLCTGFSETISPERAAAIGIRGFLLKPIVRSELSGVIRRVLQDTPS